MAKVKLGNVVDTVNDRMPNREEWYFDKYVAGEHLESEEIRVKQYGDLDGMDGVLGSAFQMHFKAGHVLFGTRRAYLRKSALVDFEGICSNTTLVLQANEGKLLQRLLPFILQSESFIRYAINWSQGSTNPYVKWTDLREFEFELPNIDEQEQLASILWSTEEHIKAVENVIEKTKILKNSMIEVLLTKGIGHTEFKKTDIGMVPKKWDVKSLGEVINLDFGKRITKTKDAGTLYPVFGGGGESFKTDSYTRENDFVVSRFAMSKECVRYVEGKFYLLDSGFTISITKDCTNKVLKSFVTSILMHSQDKIYRCGRGAAQKNLDINSFKNILIPIPCLEEQIEITQKLETLEQTLNDLLKHLHNLKLLRKKLINELIRGKMQIRTGNV